MLHTIYTRLFLLSPGLATPRVIHLNIGHQTKLLNLTRFWGIPGIRVYSQKLVGSFVRLSVRSPSVHSLVRQSVRAQHGVT